MPTIVNVTHVEEGLVHLQTWLGNWRKVVIQFDTRETGKFLISIWARDRNDPKLHLFPSPHIREDFFTREEEEIIRWGCAEVAEQLAAAGKDGPIGIPYYNQVIGALREVLNVAANGWAEETTAPA